MDSSTKIIYPDGTKNSYVQKALDYSVEYLPITKFLQALNIVVDKTIFELTWNIVLETSKNIHVSHSLLNFMGFKGSYKSQRSDFKSMLQNNNITYQEIKWSDFNIHSIPSIVEEMKFLDKYDTKPKFIFVNNFDFDHVISVLRTDNSANVNLHFCKMRQILDTYNEYTLYFNKLRSDLSIKNAINSSLQDLKCDTLDTKNLIKFLSITIEELKDMHENSLKILESYKDVVNDVDKIKQKLSIQDEPSIHNELVTSTNTCTNNCSICNQTNRQVDDYRIAVIKRNGSGNRNEYFTYYIIYARTKYVTRKIKEQQLIFSDSKVLLDLKSSHTKSLSLIKTSLKNKGVEIYGNNVEILGSAITEFELLEEIKTLA